MTATSRRPQDFFEHLCALVDELESIKNAEPSPLERSPSALSADILETLPETLAQSRLKLAHGIVDTIPQLHRRVRLALLPDTGPLPSPEESAKVITQDLQLAHQLYAMGMDNLRTIQSPSETHQKAIKALDEQHGTTEIILSSLESAPKASYLGSIILSAGPDSKSPRQAFLRATNDAAYLISDIAMTHLTLARTGAQFSRLGLSANMNSVATLGEQTHRVHTLLAENAIRQSLDVAKSSPDFVALLER